LDAALLNVEVDIEESSLRAPFSGVVSKRFRDEGAILAPGSPLLRLVDDQHLEAWIGLPAELAAQRSAGEQFLLTVGDDEVQANVASILPELDVTTRTRTVIFAVTSNDQVVPGQIVRVEIEDSAHAQGFWVPIGALTRSSRGLWSVLVAERPAGKNHMTAARRDVEVLHTTGQRSLVRGTLMPGDAVIIDGTHRVAAGQRVTDGRLAQQSRQGGTSDSDSAATTLR
jgi:RND family efflux transporter MFP subunit